MCHVCRCKCKYLCIFCVWIPSYYTENIQGWSFPQLFILQQSVKFFIPPPPPPSFHIFVLPSSLKDRKAGSTQTVRSQARTKAMKWAKPVHVWMEWTNEVKKFVLELWKSESNTHHRNEGDKPVCVWTEWAKQIKINETAEQVWMQPNRSRFTFGKQACVCVCVCVVCRSWPRWFQVDLVHCLNCPSNRVATWKKIVPLTQSLGTSVCFFERVYGLVWKIVCNLNASTTVAIVFFKNMVA